MGRVCIAAYFCWCGVVNSEKYIDILDSNLWPVAEEHFANSSWIFQDDNAPCHRSWLTESWKEDNIATMTWPAQSPDINSTSLRTSTTEKRRMWHVYGVIKNNNVLEIWHSLPTVTYALRSLYSFCIPLLNQKDFWQNTDSRGYYLWFS